MQMHDNLTSPPVDITVFDDDVASVVTAESVMASELGDSRSFVFSLALGSQPRANVTLVPQVDASDVLLFNESFVFTPSNWNIAQTAHGLVYDDEIDEGEVGEIFRVEQMRQIEQADVAQRARMPPFRPIRQPIFHGADSEDGDDGAADL